MIVLNQTSHLFALELLDCPSLRHRTSVLPPPPLKCLPYSPLTSCDAASTRGLQKQSAAWRAEDVDAGVAVEMAEGVGEAEVTRGAAGAAEGQAGDEETVVGAGALLEEGKGVQGEVAAATAPEVREGAWGRYPRGVFPAVRTGFPPIYFVFDYFWR